MKTGSNGLNLIKHFESCRLTAFKPIPTDPWTIGWGRAHGVNEGDTVSQEEADAMLVDDLGVAESTVEKGAQGALTANQFDALVSFTYNCGGAALLSSTLLRKLNEGFTLYAADEFLKWNKSKGVALAGLTRRREAERKLFLTPDAEKFVL